MKKEFIWAAEKVLEDYGKPVITAIQLAQLILKLELSKQYRDEPINIRTRQLSSETLQRRIYKITGSLIRLDPDFHGINSKSTPKFQNRVYQNLQAERGTTEQVICIINPFAYVSHLSAMAQYGFTNRLPTKLQITTPGRKYWKEHTTTPTELMDLQLYNTQIGLPDQIRNRQILIHTSEHLETNPQKTDDNVSQIASIGRCFLDMVDQPAMCGGIAHVIEVYEEHASTFIDDIITTISQHGKAISKVRAGYILDEVLGIKDSRIEGWTEHAQRGGSRKLDPVKPFNGDQYSKKWMISLNE